MSSFGENLRRERKARNIRLREIAESTKISSIYLRALEADDFAQLPGRVFNRGYVRAYAEYIGVDPVATVEAYEEAEHARGGSEDDEQRGRPHLTPVPSSASPGSRLRAVALSLVALALVASATAYFMGWRPGSSHLPDAQARIASAEALPVPPGPLKASAGQPEAPPPVEQSAPEIEESEAADRALVEPAVPPATGQPAAPRPAIGEPAPQTIAAERKPVTRSEARSQDPAPSPGPPTVVPPRGTEVRVAPVPTPAGAGQISISDHGIGGNVVDRTLQDRRSAFMAGERVYFWARVLGGEPGTIVRHVWIKDTTPVSDISIDLGGPHWRTYTWQSMREDCDGEWTVEARDAGDRVLATAEFTCGH